MATEIERKFLVADATFLKNLRGISCRQGYLCSSARNRSVVRVRTVGEMAFLTIKKAVSSIERIEYEYEIPLIDAEEMLDNLCSRPLVEKTRHKIEHAEQYWEIDVFAGQNTGLIVAEIELTSKTEPFSTPPWLGVEVSQDPRYFNFNLAQTPFSEWKE